MFIKNRIFGTSFLGSKSGRNPK